MTDNNVSIHIDRINLKNPVNSEISFYIIITEIRKLPSEDDSKYRRKHIATIPIPLEFDNLTINEEAKIVFKYMINISHGIEHCHMIPNIINRIIAKKGFWYCEQPSIIRYLSPSGCWFYTVTKASIPENRLRWKNTDYIIG